MPSKYNVKCRHFREDESDTSRSVKVALILAISAALFYGVGRYLSNPSPIATDPNTFSGLEEKAKTQIKTSYVGKNKANYGGYKQK